MRETRYGHYCDTDGLGLLLETVVTGVLAVAGGGMATLVTPRVFPPGSMSPAQDDTQPLHPAN